MKSARPLADLIFTRFSSPPVLSVLGMVKNAGKTTVTAYLITEIRKRRLTAAITSAGRDGERKDLIYGTKKPRICIEAGTLVATSAADFVNSEAKLELLEKTPFYCALGQIFIGRAVQGGEVQVSGPASTSALHAVTRRLVELGADAVLVDGGIDRLAAGAPGVSDGLILATGAALDGRMDQVVRRTRLQYEILSLKRLMDDGLRQAAAALFETHRIGFIDAGSQVVRTDAATLLGQAQSTTALINQGTEAVVIPGCLTGHGLTALYGRLLELKSCPLKIIIRDPTRLVLGDLLRYGRYFRKLKTRIRCLNQVEVIAVTTNPVSPGGKTFDAEAFLHTVARALPGVPVYDVIAARSVAGRDS